MMVALRRRRAAASGDSAGAGCRPASPRCLLPSTYWMTPSVMPTPAAANPTCQLTLWPR